VVTHIPETAVAPTLPGRAVLAASRRLVVVAVLAGVAYSLLSTGSRGGPAVTSGSGHLMSVDLVLRPSPVVHLALGVVYVVAVQWALARAVDEAHALRLFRRAMLVVVLLAVGSAVIADLWFFSAPLAGWPEPGSWIAPFPFAAQDVSVSPVRG
jgi:hypothetical protein